MNIRSRSIYVFAAFLLGAAACSSSSNNTGTGGSGGSGGHAGSGGTGGGGRGGSTGGTGGLAGGGGNGGTSSGGTGGGGGRAGAGGAATGGSGGRAGAGGAATGGSGGRAGAGGAATGGGGGTSAGGAGGTSAGGAGGTSAGGTGGAVAALTDPQIAGIDLEANNGEIQEAQLAESKSTNTAVLSFAGMMITAHTGNLTQLQNTLDGQGLTTADSPQRVTLMTMTAQTYNMLFALSGAAFDMAYAMSQVTAHTNVLNLLDQTLIPSATNPALKTELQAERAGVAAHLVMAQNLVATLASDGGVPHADAGTDAH